MNTFRPFVLSTWLPAIEATIQHALENVNAINVDLFAPIRWIWNAFWWLIGKILKALALGFASFTAVIAYAAGPFGWWSIPLAIIALFVAAPIAFILWLLIWGGILTCRFASFVVRAILHKPADKDAQRQLHHQHKIDRRWILFGLILLFVLPPFGTIAGVVLIAAAILEGAFAHWQFWYPPKPEPIEVHEA